jgi:hypothetical protein
MKCQQCGARATLALCRRCVAELCQMLTDLSWLLRELEVTARRADRLCPGQSRVADYPMPINVDAVELLQTVATTLAAVAQAPAGGPREVVWWCRTHFGVLIRSEEAGALFATVSHLVGNAGYGPLHDVINRPERRFAGICPECGHFCYCRYEDVFTVCRSCGIPIDVERNRMSTIENYDLLPERVLLTVLDHLEEHVPRVTFYGWVKDGRLPNAGYLGRNGVVRSTRVSVRDPKVYSLKRVRALRRRDSIAATG